MRGSFESAGVQVDIESDLQWVSDLVSEGTAGELRPPAQRPAPLRVRVESDRRPFPGRGWRYVSRGVWARRGEVVIDDVCTTGFDLHARTAEGQATFTYRWRPCRRSRAASIALRSRFHLLVRAALIQYPALWWAGTLGRAPLHASAVQCAHTTPLLCAASGVGRSTLLLAEVERGHPPTSDNIGVSDGEWMWGMLEPARVLGGAGRRMPHGRGEVAIPGRAAALAPSCVVELERGGGEVPVLVPCAPETAARALVTSTYMAGELRRYWAFAAVLAAGTGRGPSHPPVGDTASRLTTRLPCWTLVLGREPGARLDDLLPRMEAERWVS
jgi:hypothetical protein